MIATSRLLKELADIRRYKETDVVLIPEDGNVLLWTAYIEGPEDTPYEGGTFKLAIRVSESYPHVAPSFRFVTKVFHPNVHFTTGEICLDVLKDAWSPAWTLQSTCRAIIALLANPEADSPLNCDCGNLIRAGDLRGYRSAALMYTRLEALQKQSK